MAKKKAYRYPLYLLIRLVAGLFYLLPRRFSLWLARIFSRLGFYLVSRQRNQTMSHLKSAYGHEKDDREIVRIAKGVFENLSQTGVEILQSPKFRKKKLEDFVDVGNAIEVYRSLLEEKKGILSITAHMGNWELLAGIFGLSGFQGAVVGRHLYYEPYNQWILGLRQSMGVRTIYREEAARHILLGLKKNQIIGVLPDQDVNSLPGIFVPFFGMPAYTMTAPVRLALSMGAPIVVSFLIRQRGDRYKLVIGDVIRPKVEHDRDDAVKKYTLQWMAQFEKMIREYPEQWAWMHNRWETKPTDADKYAGVKRGLAARL